MTRTRTGTPPAYRLHKATGQAVVTVRRDGTRHDVYLGEYGSDASHEAYNRILVELRLPAAPRLVTGGARLTVAELMERFLDHAEVYYRRPDGTQTSEVAEFKRTIRAVRKIYGSLPAAEFTALKLAAVREEMIAAELCRGVVNQRTGRIVRMFKWGVSQELVAAAVHQGLASVAGLREGRTAARETEPVRPVEWKVVEDTLPHLNRAVQAMVRLQRLTGMRSEELCKLRTCDIDRSVPVWLYRPAWHKTKGMGKRRVIAFGPRAQELLTPFLRDADPGRVLFSPRDFPRGSWGKTRLPGETYAPLSYCDTIAKTCERQGLAHWHPHQLRHAFATAVRQHYGLDVAQVALGHAHADVTEVYAELNEEQVVALAREVG
jgi:integrase